MHEYRYGVAIVSIDHDYFLNLILGRKEGNVLFNDALNTFYFTAIWRRT